MRYGALILLLGPVLFAAGCHGTPAKSILVATTTSIRDTGLLDELLPIFRAKTGIEVRVVAVGTGQALEIGRRGDADAVLTHDPTGEERFVGDGFGTKRLPVMWNEFVLVGPPEDPARVRSAKSGAEAFRRLREQQAVFISRGDESGTHQKEKAIWASAKIEPVGAWYVRAGQGMGAVLRMADEKRGYTLSDWGTYLAQRDRLHLVIIYKGDPEWINPYAVLPVNPNKHRHVKHDLAQQFADFLISEETQQLIADFGREKFGEPLFRVDLPSKGGGQ